MVENEPPIQPIISTPEYLPRQKTLWIAWIIVGLVFLTLVVGSIAFFVFDERKSEILQGNNGTQPQEGTSSRSLAPPVDPKCENAPDAQTGLVCYARLALEQQNIRYCQHLPEEYQELCEVQVYYESAKRQKDPSLCEKIKQQDARDNCYSDIAVEIDDPKTCEKIQNRSASKYNEQMPYEYCYQKIAETRNDSALCDRIITDLKRNNCYVVVGTRTNNVEVCKKITRGEQLESFIVPCYMLIAQNTGNAALCENLKSEQSDSSGSRETCITNVNRALALRGNTAACEAIAKSDFRHDDCYHDVAIELNNPELCKNINASSAKWSCYRRIGEKRKDPRVCDPLAPDRFELDYCYARVAGEIGDKSICPSIATSVFKEKCDRGEKDF